MKKILGFLTALVLFCQTQAQKTELDAMTNKCPGGRCQSDCWFTDCSLCCPAGTRPECSCFFEFSRCNCKTDIMYPDAVITVHAERLTVFVGWLKQTGNRLLIPFSSFQNSLLSARTTDISGTDYRVSPDKYAAALAAFEKAVAGLSATEDYRKAQAEIGARMLAR
jgi:hypothetical protein